LLAEAAQRQAQDHVQIFEEQDNFLKNKITVGAIA